MKDLKKEVIKKITFRVFDKETNSYVEDWKCLGDGINKDGVLCVPTYEKSLSPVSKQFEYHIQEELYTKEEVDEIKLQEKKKTLEEVWNKYVKRCDFCKGEGVWQSETDGIEGINDCNICNGNGFFFESLKYETDLRELSKLLKEGNERL